jgi:maltose O-acetyltransferase
MTLTAWLPDVQAVMRLRGALLKPALGGSGRDFQVASGVRLVHAYNIHVGTHVFVGRGCWLHAPGGIVLDDEVQLGPYVVLVTGDHSMKQGSYRFGPGVRGPIRIGRGAWIAAHATVSRGVTVGEGALLAANAVATRDVPPFTVAGGVPARPVRVREPLRLAGEGKG